jgi:membrane protein required for colicin V production
VTAFDYAVLAVVGVSVLLGLWRGVIGEVLALLGWVLAFAAARLGAASGARLLDGVMVDPALRLATAMIVIFIAVLLLVALVRFLVRKAVQAVGLGFLDRLLGAVFGILRGALVVLSLVAIGGLTALPKLDWWRDAALAPPLETAVIALKPHLPDELAKRIRFR